MSAPAGLMRLAFAFTGTIVIAVGMMPHETQAERVTFDKKDGKKANIECTCVLGASGCQIKNIDEVGEALRLKWVHVISVPSGSVELNEVCYRKRDTAPGAAGACCTDTDEKKSILNLFRGRRQQ